MRRKLNRKGKFFLFVLVLLIIVLLLPYSYVSVIKAATASESAKLAERAVASAVNTAAQELSLSLDEMLRTQTNADGSVSVISADTASLNIWKEKLIELVEARLENGTYETKVPIGTLTGNYLFYGRGFRVPLRLSLGGYINAETESVFDSAGINQTRYGLYLNVSTTVHTYLPLYHTQFETENRILISECILVGEVPALYTAAGLS